MHKDMRRYIDLLVGIAVLAVVVLGFIRPAAAYPPGTNLTITSNKVHVAAGERVTLTANHAQPGTRVKFSLCEERKRVTADEFGVASVSLRAEERGICQAKAVNGAEVATTTVYVPKVSLVRSDSEHRQGSAVRVQYAQPGSVISVVVGSATYTGTGAGSSPVVISFNAPKKFRGAVMVYVNTQLITAFHAESRS